MEKKTLRRKFAIKITKALSFSVKGDIVLQSLKFNLYSKGPRENADLYEIGSLSGRYDTIR